ncbi:MAG: carboxypeptidase-like regulatory domain-containing protein, partial [Gemmatimonadales bacterium]|nr:carboxypeptidase-like regulatory domain-containing protein [Gemmatimonadales bacterium]
MLTYCRGLVLTALIVVGLPSPGSGQGILKGTVSRDSSLVPLGGVEILIEGTTLRTTTSASGHYRLSNVPSGNQVVLVRLVGYLPQREQLLFRLNDSTFHDVVLVRQDAQVLDSVEVTGRVTRGVGIGFEALEERRSRGFGKFILSDELRRGEHRRVSDLLWGMQGIRIVRLFGGFYAASGRGETSIVRGVNVQRDPYCFLSVYLDGRALYNSGD